MISKLETQNNNKEEQLHKEEKLFIKKDKEAKRLELLEQEEIGILLEALKLQQVGGQVRQHLVTYL